MPNLPPRPCPKHPRVLLTKGEACPICPAYNWKPDRIRGNATQRGYGKEWRVLRTKVMKRDNYLCQPCKRKGYMKSANEVDHITPKAQGGTDNPNNLQAICTQCHRDKTAIESHK